MSAGPSGSRRDDDGAAGSSRAASFSEQVSGTLGPDVDFAATDGFLHPADPSKMDPYQYLNYRNMITLGDMIQASRLETRELIAKLQKAEDRPSRAMSQDSTRTSIAEQDEDDDDDDAHQSDGTTGASTGSGQKKKSGAKPPAEVKAAVEKILEADTHGFLETGFGRWIEKGHTPRLRRSSQSQDVIDAEAKEFFATHMEKLRSVESEAVISKVQEANLATQVNLFIKLAVMVKKKSEQAKDKGRATTPARSASRPAIDADSEDDVLTQSARRTTTSRGRSKQIISRTTPRRAGDVTQSADTIFEGQESIASRSASAGSAKRKRSSLTIRDTTGERRHMDSSDVDIEHPRTKEFQTFQDSDDESLG